MTENTKKTRASESPEQPMTTEECLAHIEHRLVLLEDQEGRGVPDQLLIIEERLTRIEQRLTQVEDQGGRGVPAEVVAHVREQTQRLRAELLHIIQNECMNNHTPCTAQEGGLAQALKQPPPYPGEIERAGQVGDNAPTGAGAPNYQPNMARPLNLPGPSAATRKQGQAIGIIIGETCRQLYPELFR